MSERIVKLSFTYEVEFIPYCHRFTRGGHIRTDGQVKIRTVAAESAPVSCRIRCEDLLPHRQILEEFIAFDWTDGANPSSDELQDASEILRRLDLVNVAELSAENKAALAEFASYADAGGADIGNERSAPIPRHQ